MTAESLRDFGFCLLRCPALSSSSRITIMIIIRFLDDESKRRALGWLAGRFSFKSWATGEMMVPDEALPFLAREGIRFQLEGPPNDSPLLRAYGSIGGKGYP